MFSGKRATALLGLIVCAKKDAAVAKYALESPTNQVLAAEHRTVAKARRELEARKSL